MKHPFLAAAVAIGVSLSSLYFFSGQRSPAVEPPTPAVFPQSAALTSLRRGIIRQLHRLAASQENGKEHRRLLAEIEQTLEEKEEEIDALADWFYAEHQCTDGFGDVLDQQSVFDFIAAHTRYMERELHLTEGADHFSSPFDRHFDTLEIGRYLRRIRVEHFSPEGPPSLAHMLAAARSYERCLSERGLVDIYRDMQREVEYGNCSEAEHLASYVGDFRSIWRIAKHCTPTGEAYSSTVTTDQFYDRLEDATDEDLSLAAEFVDWEDYDRYRIICADAREVEGEERSQAYAFCAADFAYSRISPEESFSIPNSTPEILERMIAHLPPSQQKRICILQTAEARIREQQGTPQAPDAGIFSEYDYFRRCLDEKL